MRKIFINKLKGGSIIIRNSKTMPLCFTAQQANSTVILNGDWSSSSGSSNPYSSDPYGGGGSSSYRVNLEYKLEGSTNKDWTRYTGQTITLANVNDKMYMRAMAGGNTTISSDGYQYQFKMNGKIAASGNIQTLLDQTGKRMDVPDYCYYTMFYGCTSLTNAPELPATTLTSSCYQYMFYGCTSLTSAPELPAKNLARSCYSYMFNGCTSLKRIKMNASSGSWGTNMFNGCTSLELVDMTGSIGVPTLSNVNNFDNTNDTYKIVVPDSLYNTWIAATNWASIASHIMKKSDWNAAHPDDILT